MNITFSYNNKSHLIKFDGTAYSPIRTYISEDKKTGEKSESQTADGYFKNVGGAVKRIIDNEMGADESTVTLLAYVQRYEQAVREIRGIIREEEF